MVIALADERSPQSAPAVLFISILHMPPARRTGKQSRNKLPIFSRLFRPGPNLKQTLASCFSSTNAFEIEAERARNRARNDDRSAKLHKTLGVGWRWRSHGREPGAGSWELGKDRRRQTASHSYSWRHRIHGSV